MLLMCWVFLLSLLEAKNPPQGGRHVSTYSTYTCANAVKSCSCKYLMTREAFGLKFLEGTVQIVGNLHIKFFAFFFRESGGQLTALSTTVLICIIGIQDFQDMLLADQKLAGILS